MQQLYQQELVHEMYERVHSRNKYNCISGKPRIQKIPLEVRGIRGCGKNNYFFFATFLAAFLGAAFFTALAGAFLATAFLATFLGAAFLTAFFAAFFTGIEKRLKK